MLTNEIIAEDSSFSTKSLIIKVHDYTKELTEVPTSEALFKFILSDFVTLSDYFIDLGNLEYEKIEGNEPTDLKETYLIHYTLSEAFKDLAVLHRDVLLELQISKNKFIEGLVSKEAIESHFKSSKEILNLATQSFTINIEEEYDGIYKPGKKKLNSIDDIKHRKNPWEIYKGHFLTIISQIKDIANSGSSMVKAIKNFSDIRNHNSEFLNSVGDEAEMLKTQIGVAIKSLKELNDTDQITEFTNWIDSSNGIIKDKNLRENYMGTIEQKIKMLSDLTLPISTNDGVLFMRKINFSKTVEKWIDFEILPLLIDLMENRDNMVSYFRHSILNLKTGLLVEKSNASLESVSSQLQTVKNVHFTLTSNSEKVDSIIAEIRGKFENHFRATEIYSDNEFLEVSLQSSLTQFAVDQSTFLSGLKKRVDLRLARFNSKYEPNALFSTQNKIETAVACINYRMNKEADAHYDTLFLNRYFMGDLFLLPRIDQEKEFLNSIAQWKNGFNKAILVTGDSLSGKTIFVNNIVLNHFAKNSVVLKKNSNITFNGRKFSTSSDLGEALQQIKRNIGSTSSVLIIDDLELWMDDKHTLLNNTRSLIEFIESESDEIMVIVTTSDQMRNHLDKRLRFSNIFTSTIDLSKAKLEEIYKAVLIRHGASHKTLVSKEGQELTSAQIEKNVLKLAKSLDYNIGEVLQAWTYDTTLIADNKVIYHQENFPFKDFFSPEEIIILKHVLLYKQLNELTLKGYVGSRYKDYYRSALKRLVNTKVLLRTDTGLLNLNPVLVKDIKRLLIYKDILN